MEIKIWRGVSELSGGSAYVHESGAIDVSLVKHDNAQTRYRCANQSDKVLHLYIHTAHSHFAHLSTAVWCKLGLDNATLFLWFQRFDTNSTCTVREVGLMPSFDASSTLLSDLHQNSK